MYIHIHPYICVRVCVYLHNWGNLKWTKASDNIKKQLIWGSCWKYYFKEKELTFRRNILKFHRWIGTVYSLVAQTVKCLPTMWETRVQSLGWEDLLVKEMAPHSSILAWKIPWTGEPARLQSMEIPSPTQWTWIWANSRRQSRTGKPGVLQSMGSQRVRCYLATEQQQKLPSQQDLDWYFSNNCHHCLAELTYKINHHSSHILFFLSRINLPLVDEKLEYAFILVKDLSCIAF